MKNLFSVLFGVFLIVNLAGCFNSSPRDEYVDELEDKYNELITLLENPSSEIEIKVYSASFVDKNGQQRIDYPEDEKAPVRWSSEVVSKAEAVQKHFNSVSLAFMKQDLDDFDKWSASFKSLNNKYRAIAYRHIESIEKDFIVNPDKYKSFLFGQNLVQSKDKVYFIGHTGGSAYNIRTMLDIDIDSWLEQIKEKAESLQGNK